ncbi:MAG: hypothetical protein LBO74_07090 [Candidatus Symbiothrix sp.]|nr:hypothetical protein [Candidatus Symbiothrix sp.]
MKKIVFLLFWTLFATGCSTTRNNYPIDNYKHLTVGMSKSEVEYWVGPPECYLDMRRTAYGYREILQYRNIYNEVYALEFLNDYLVSADYIYGDIWHPMYPVAQRPPFGRPIFPPGYRPNYPPPSPPSHIRPPQDNNNNTSRPPSNPRPPSSSRPPANTPPPTTLPATPLPPATTRPSTGSTNSGRESTRESSSSTNQSTGTGRESTRQ